MVILQLREPLHAPRQPAKRDPMPATGVSTTRVPSAKLAVQLAVQLDALPAGENATVPVPVPLLSYASVCMGMALKVAVTARAESTLTRQLLAPEQAPPQPTKREPVAGLAVSTTLAAASNALVQLSVQLASLPAGEKLTVPAPVPARV